MLSRDQKTMLGFGVLAMGGILLHWLVSNISPADAGALGKGMSGMVVALTALVGVVLVVLSVFIPLFIYFIYCDVKKMREIAERNERKIEQLRVDFAYLKQMWSKH